MNEIAPSKFGCVSMVYRSQSLGCGIQIFQHHFAHYLRRRGFSVGHCNVAKSGIGEKAVTVLHYTPHMWAHHTDILEGVLDAAAPGLTVVVLHSIHAPHARNYLSETRSPHLRRHLEAMDAVNAVVLSLSTSCTATLESWGIGISRRTVTGMHPGLFVLPDRECGRSHYAFLGGVRRPKKDPDSELTRALLEACQRFDIDVWFHATNDADYPALNPDLPVWRRTTGVMDDEGWSAAIARATVVLCPYHTRMQCVSGVMAEAVSAGTAVIATAFPFAEELASAYPDYVRVENDLSLWPGLIGNVSYSSLKRPTFYSWDLLVRDFIRALRYA